MDGDYVTLAGFTAYLQASEIAADQDVIQSALLAAERSINRHCARRFAAPSGSASSRSYVPRGDEVVTHDFDNTTGLVVTDDGATVSSSEYQLEPLNNLTASGLTVPFYRIRLINSCWARDGKRATVTVNTARWGWAAVPAEVPEATMILGKDLAHMRGTRFGVAGFDTFGAVRVRENPVVASLLTELRHPNAIGIA